MFEGVIYFAGPKTRWAGTVNEEEIIARIHSRFQWFALWLTRSAHASLDPCRCGYVLIKDGELLEHVEVKS